MDAVSGGALHSSELISIVRTDPSGVVTYWNRGAELILGYPSSEALGRRCAEFLYADGGEEGHESLSRAKAKVLGETRGAYCEVRGRGKDGRGVWVGLCLTPCVNSEGCIVGLLGVGQNITERKEAQERLVKSNERYRVLLQLLPDIVYVISPEGNFAFVSDSIRNLGYEPEDLVGRHFSVLVHPEDLPHVSRDHVLPRFQGKMTGPAAAPKLFDERRSGDRKTTNLEVRLVPRKGSTAHGDRVAIVSAVNASGHYMAVDGPPGLERQFLGTVGVMCDITDRKRAEDERRKLEEQLHQARKMEAIGQLAGGVAHDFNNMLSGISGYAEVIRRRNRDGAGNVDDPVLEGHIGVIIKAAERAGDLTTKLLAFSRQGKYEVVPVNLHETVHDVIGLLQHTVDKRVEIRQRLRARAPTVMGDHAQLENAVLNLAVNACDAMPEGGVLTFSTEVTELGTEEVGVLPYRMEPGKYVLLAVTDTGIGMGKSISEHIFEPFFTTKEEGKGTGLGLASVYGTVKSHHGAIEARSTPGKGSVFSVYLPLCAGTGSGTASAEERLERGSGTVLIVDDEEIVRNILGQMLGELGYNVEQAENGARALELYRGRVSSIDLVILDMNMPVMGGSDCFRELKQMNPGVKVIVTTGYTHASMMREINLLGAAAVILKPFKFASLSEQIGAVLRS